jgi:hypothetical protein
MVPAAGEEDATATSATATRMLNRGFRIMFLYLGFDADAEAVSKKSVRTAASNLQACF